MTISDRQIKKIGMTETTRLVGVSAERLRYWELKGVISPIYVRYGTKKLRRYSLNDIDLAKEIRRLVEIEGYTLKGAAERLNRPYND